MKITAQHTDELILKELGQRIERSRLSINLSQADVAERAGISVRTLQRLESGAVATSLVTLIRVLRELDLIGHLDAFLPSDRATPMELLSNNGKPRRRASRQRVSPNETQEWTWGDEP